MLPISPSTSLKRSISTPNTLCALRAVNSVEDDPYSERTKPLTLGGSTNGSTPQTSRFGTTSTTNRLFLETSPEELAKQITLIDWTIFSRITSKELKPGQWTGPMKHMLSPNVVAFTRRFNILSYWISDEILGLSTAKKRAEILGYFIKVAAYLIEIKSLNSAFAIFCTLTSEPIHRLAKTWQLLSKKEKLAFEKIMLLFNQTENSSTLRAFMNQALEQAPANCIPNLSIFLTDIIHIGSFYSASGTSEERTRKLELIYGFLRKCQQSNFDHIQLIEEVYDYLNTFSYIEELQKFREDDYYALSTKLEPPEDKSQTVTSGASRDGQTLGSKSKFYYGRFNSNYDISSSGREASPRHVASNPTGSRLQPFLMHELKADNLNKSLNENLLFDQQKRPSVPPGGSTSGTAFKPGHRKTNSLEMGVLNVSRNAATLPKNTFTSGAGTAHSSNNSISGSGSARVSRGASLHVNLIDDSPAFDVFANHLHHESNSSTRKPHLEVVRNGERTEEDAWSIDEPDSRAPGPKSYYTERDFLCSGPVARKTILKIGKKPSLPFWTNFYLGLTSDSLLFFAGKQPGASSKLKPLKRLYLLDWTIAFEQGTGSGDKCNIFTLADRNCSTVYKIRTDSEATAKEWTTTIRKVTANLKSFYI